MAQNDGNQQQGLADTSNVPEKHWVSSEFSYFGTGPVLSGCFTIITQDPPVGVPCLEAYG